MPEVTKKVHELKTVNPFFNLISLGHKTCEVRFNDRGYQIGDILRLIEYNPDSAYDKYSGREIDVEVTHVMTSDDFIGVKEGWVVMSIRVISKNYLPDLSIEETYP